MCPAYIESEQAHHQNDSTAVKCYLQMAAHERFDISTWGLLRRRAVIRNESWKRPKTCMHARWAVPLRWAQIVEKMRKLLKGKSACINNIFVHFLQALNWNIFNTCATCLNFIFRCGKSAITEYKQNMALLFSPYIYSYNHSCLLTRFSFFFPFSPGMVKLQLQSTSKTWPCSSAA